MLKLTFVYLLCLACVGQSMLRGKSLRKEERSSGINGFLLHLERGLQEVNRTCPTESSSYYQAFDDVRPCVTNEDCEGYTTIDGETCCLHPFCICQNPDPGAKSVGCVADVLDRTGDGDGDDPDVVIGAPAPSVSSEPSTSPVAPTPFPTDPVDGPFYCPSSQSYLYVNVPGGVTCTENSDCTSGCCMHPYCLCQGSFYLDPQNIVCADDPVRTDDGGNSTEDIPIVTDAPIAPTPAPVETPETTTPVETPETPAPVETPETTAPVETPETPAPVSSASRVCPDAISANYQSQDGVRSCVTNGDCDGFNTPDGPTCCLHPFCICQNPNPGASVTAGCVTE